MNAVSLTGRIRARALELGFERVGVAPARRAARAALFSAWLDRGFHGEMHYLARDPDARADPSRASDWARSVVAVAMNYLPAGSGWSRAPGLLPRLSRYAAGEDYHEVIGERLRALMEFVREEAPGARGRIAVDTSALLEKDFAEAAGVGWAAKNTQIITEGLGSWTFLGELILDLELEYDAPPEDRCGSCRACVDACPTGAILEGRMLDATRCISYLNIELRGAVPSGQREALGDHLFGCDICQEVCPWNDGAPETRLDLFRPRRAYEDLSLADVARMDESGFREVFAGSAIRRARRRGLVRNALIVGANLGDGETLEAAGPALEDPDPVVRATAAWAVGKGGGGSGRDALERARARETDPDVAAEIERALAGDQ